MRECARRAAITAAAATSAPGPAAQVAAGAAAAFAAVPQTLHGGGAVAGTLMEGDAAGTAGSALAERLSAVVSADCVAVLFDEGSAVSLRVRLATMLSPVPWSLTGNTCKQKARANIQYAQFDSCAAYT